TGVGDDGDGDLHSASTASTNRDNSGAGSSPLALFCAACDAFSSFHSRRMARTQRVVSARLMNVPALPSDSRSPGVGWAITGIPECIASTPTMPYDSYDDGTKRTREIGRAH